MSGGKIEYNPSKVPDIELRKAKREDWREIMNLVHETVQNVYPHYYPSAVVDFFCEFHDKERILGDIQKGNVWVLVRGGKIIGTGSVEENRIDRLYVLPECQKKGHGTYIIRELEKEIAKSFKTVSLEASLASCMLYEKMGYHTVRHEWLQLPGDVVFVWDVMEKEL